MTRETKIGLFVGMGVIILLGILISDHLSEAQRQEPASLADATRPSELDADQPVRLDSASTGDTPVLVPPSGSRAVASGESARPAESLTLRQDIRTNIIDRPAQPAEVEEPREEPAVASQDRKELDPALWEPVKDLNGARTREIVPTPKERFHFVKKGESLASIARQYYGNTNEWHKIYEANRDVVPDHSRMRIGVRLRIPAVGDASARRLVEPVAKPKFGTHTVASGETLSDLAAEYLGTAAKWRELYQLNQDVIRDPDVVKPGTVLRVPNN